MIHATIAALSALAGLVCLSIGIAHAIIRRRASRHAERLLTLFRQGDR